MNGHWTPLMLSTLLAGDEGKIIQQPHFKEALKWIQRLTLILQNAQGALYEKRHIELLSAKRAKRAATVISDLRRRAITRTTLLYQAWKLSYSPTSGRLHQVRKRHLPLLPDPRHHLHSCTTKKTKWVQHFRRISRNANAALLSTRSNRKLHKQGHLSLL